MLTTHEKQRLKRLQKQLYILNHLRIVGDSTKDELKLYSPHGKRIMNELRYLYRNGLIGIDVTPVIVRTQEVHRYQRYFICQSPKLNQLIERWTNDVQQYLEGVHDESA